MLYQHRARQAYSHITQLTDPRVVEGKDAFQNEHVRGINGCGPLQSGMMGEGVYGNLCSLSGKAGLTERVRNKLHWRQVIVTQLSNPVES
jgi:hypothetical protein